MYTTYTGKGWEAYPHTQTAVNNFMGLHLWDSWAFTAMGSWVADKWAWGHGNVLSWKFMVPFRNKSNAMPDNFGIAWYYKPWGSMYYNWDGAMVDLILRQVAGVSYSIPAGTLTVCDHLPESWSFVETRLPIVLDGKTKWVTVRAARQATADGRAKKTLDVRDCPLGRLVIQPWLEDCEAISRKALDGKAPRGHAGWAFTNVRGASVSVTLGKRRRGPLIRAEGGKGEK